GGVGVNAWRLQGAENRHEAIVRLMVGRELKQFFQRTHVPPREGPPLVRCQGIRLTARQSQPIQFSLHGGEIVGLAGLMGAGRTELAEALFGVTPPLAGEVYVAGRPVPLRNPDDAIAAGIFLIPEDRRVQGLVLAASVRENISLPSLDRLSWMRLVSPRRERELTQSMCQRLNIRTPGMEQT